MLSTLGDTDDVMRPLLVLPLLALALSACGSGGQRSATGEVSDIEGRLCLHDQKENGRCYDATPAQLAGVVRGSCIKIDYEQANGEVGRVTRVAPAKAPCVG
jgi:hypothetical protein